MVFPQQPGDIELRNLLQECTFSDIPDHNAKYQNQYIQKLVVVQEYRLTDFNSCACLEMIDQIKIWDYNLTYAISDDRHRSIIVSAGLDTFCDFTN